MYNTNSQINFKTTMVKLCLRYYSDAYILAKESISVRNTTATGNAN